MRGVSACLTAMLLQTFFPRPFEVQCCQLADDVRQDIQRTNEELMHRQVITILTRPAKL